MDCHQLLSISIFRDDASSEILIKNMYKSARPLLCFEEEMNLVTEHWQRGT